MRDSKESFKRSKKDDVKSTSTPMPLPLKLKKNGFTYIQYLKNEKAFIYAQWHENTIVGYEVFLKKIGREKNIKGKVIPPKVRFPNDEAFGYWAWTVKTRDRAIEKFIDITGLGKNDVEHLINNENGRK